MENFRRCFCANNFCAVSPLSCLIAKDLVCAQKSDGQADCQPMPDSGLRERQRDSQLETHLIRLCLQPIRYLHSYGEQWHARRYEVDKLTASQRLDLNLEKGRMRDELQALRDKANELEVKMDKETNSLKAGVEQTKNETIKYCLGMMLAFTTAGLGAARLVSR